MYFFVVLFGVIQGFNQNRIGIQFTVVLVLFALLVMAGIAAAGGRPLAADLIKAIRQIEDGSAVFTPQDNSQATFTKILTRDTGKIDWSKSVNEIDQQIRALNPWPGTWTEWQGKRVKVLKATPSDDQSDSPVGAFQNHQGSLAVPTGDRCLLIIDLLQVEGKGPTSGADFVRGYLK